MKKIFGFFMLGLFLIGLVASFSLPTEVLSTIGCNGLIQFKSEIIGKEIPSQVPFSNEIVNVYINDEIFGSIIIKDKFVDDVSCEKNSEMTYEVYIKDYSTVADLISSEDKLQTVKDKIDNKEIEVKGIGLNKKLKWFFSKIALKWFI